MTKEYTPPVWGCAEDTPDERDYKYEDVMGAAPSDMPSFEEGYDSEEKYGKLRDDHQGYSLGCVSFGSTNDMEMMIKIKTGRDINLSQRFIYSQVHLPGGGASPREAYKLLNQTGVCEEQYMPVEYGYQNLTEAKMRSKEGLEEAKKHADYKIGAYRSVGTADLNVIAQAVFENGGCGGGYRLINQSMGHFIFLKGYGMHNGYKGIRYKDSYNPYDKWIIKKGNNFYLDRVASGQQIQLYSFWTAEAGNWAIPMDTKLVKKKGTKEVFLQVNGKRYWIKNEIAFTDLNAGGLTGSWTDITEVDEFETPYEGDIIGSPNFSDVLKNLLGFGK